MKHLKNSNLWLSIIVSVGTLLGVGLGAYITKEVPQTEANYDTMCVLETTEDCTDGTWSQWNLTDKETLDPSTRLAIPPHSRIYIGVTKLKRGIWAWNAEDCRTGRDSGMGDSNQPIFGENGWIRDEDGIPIRASEGEAGEVFYDALGPSVCAMEQQDLTDPDTNVKTINEEPGCTGPECDIPPSF